MSHGYTLLDVFTDRVFTGNQLAVFEPDHEIPAELMQKIAAELNLAEVVFIYPTTINADFALRVFTPKSEIDFAGHPTIGAMHYLRNRGHQSDTVIFRANAGLIRVTYDNDMAVLESPVYPKKVLPAVELAPSVAAQMLGLDNADIGPVEAYSAGTPFLIIPVCDADAVSRMRLNIARWQDAYTSTGIAYVTAFCEVESDSLEPQLKVRTFTPSDGIVEDPATGSAVAALGGLLAERGRWGRFRVTQGTEIGRHSEISLMVSHGSVRVGGKAVVVGTGVLNIG